MTLDYPEDLAFFRATYAELDRRAKGLAHHLRDLGVGPEVRVALLLERSLARVTATLAILQAGGCYVPLDPSYPAERLAFLLRDSAAAVVLTESGRLATLPPGDALVLCLDRDETMEWMEREADGMDPLPEVGPEALAYIMYTSGSTGTPKGVAVPHRGVVRLVREVGHAAFGPREVFLQLAAYAFDASTFELWGALLHGSRLVMPPPGTFSLAELGDLLARHGVTTLALTAGLFHQMVEENLAGLAGVRQLLTGGDVLSVPHVLRVVKGLPDMRLIACYGPTEGTTFTCCLPVGGPADVGFSVPLGRPIADTLAYVVDRELAPVPAGVPGELLVGGDGLARGYLDRPGLTAERFVPSPFARALGERLYRTGDRVRLLADGRIEFLGRLDSQVKIRGFRVEPGEVEAVLAAEPGVRDAVVIVREDAPGDRRLVAYVVSDPEGPPGAGVLREALQRKLPEPLVPSAIVLLEALPLTAHGKVDRRALPAPEVTGRQEESYLGPRGPVEELLVEIWSEVLRRERVGVEDDFFALGGHSLLATQVTSRVQRKLGVELPLRTLFACPTIASLATEVERSLGQKGSVTDLASRPPRSPGTDVPLSFAQQRLWFLDRLKPGSALYNIPLAVRVTGRLCAGTLGRCLAEIERRHEALRSVIVVREDGTPVQVVRPPAFTLPLVDLSGLGLTVAERLALGPGGLLSEEAGRPFDLERGPLWRGRLLRFGREGHLLLLDLHHIVSDGWSMGILLGELQALYPSFSAGRPSPLPDLPLQYADFALWQRGWLEGEELERQLEHWKRQLAGAPEVLDLPTDRPRPAVQTFAGANLTFTLPDALAAGLEALSRGSGATLFMTLLAAFQALLGRYSGQDDLVVGTPVAGRTQVLTEGLIGLFVNNLAIRTDLAGDPELVELLARVREGTLQAFAHQDLPLEKLVGELQLRRDLSHAPLFQVAFALQNVPVTPFAIPGLELAPIAVDNGTAKFDLTVSVVPTGGSLTGALEYNQDLFDRVTIERLARHFERLLAGAVDEPRRRLSQLPLLSEAERAQIFGEWNDTAKPCPQVPLVHERFAAHARRDPNATAVASPLGRLTYGELERRANRLAHHLRGRGIGPERRVAICTDRTLDRVVGIVAVLKSGGAYVSLDPAYPPERLAFLLEDAGAPVLLTEERFVARLPECAAEVLCLDADWGAVEGDEEVTPASGVGPENLAYVVYTSGSTGKPKGVEIPHAGLMNLVRWHQDLYGVTPEDRGTQIASPAFDASIWELWPYLAAGASVHIPDEETRLSPAGMVRWWSAEGITLAYLMTPLAEGVLEEKIPPDLDLPVRALIIGGDRLHRGPDPKVGFRLMNHYGPAEYTVTSTVVEVPPLGEERGLPTIGRPVDNTVIYVLDRHQQPVPVGVPGELYVAGLGLARGYLRRPDLTAEKFVPDPWSAEPGARMYRTADLVRYLPDGDMDFLGRLDHQVKLRGLRIELGEIETVLGEYSGVREVVVLAREDRPGDKRLVAYLTPAVEPGPTPDELRGFLAERLPAYMVPAAFLCLSSFPLSANGKVDRKALPAPEWAPREAYVAPRGAVEEALAAIWAAVLGVERVGAEDNFFSLGGNSIAGAILIARLQEKLGEVVHVIALFDHPTVSELAAYLTREHAGAVARLWGEPTAAARSALPGCLVGLQRGGPGRRPLFLAHPAFGDVQFYRHLARALDPER
ncbi:MAG TPA: amino acid adenylation domain-containing protein, partial [Thermoanaerobaculia bacterium]|nr:amino acid adenylation domain-containing protein [Thermoanaerobaculia bacterium]